MDDAVDLVDRIGVGRRHGEVSKQPPWSIAMSTSTDPRFIVFSISRVTSLGAAAPGTSTAPITSSAFSTALAIAAREAKAVLIWLEKNMSSSARRSLLMS